MTENDMECYDKKILNQKEKRERERVPEREKNRHTKYFYI